MLRGAVAATASLFLLLSHGHASAQVMTGADQFAAASADTSLDAQPLDSDQQLALTGDMYYTQAPSDPGFVVTGPDMSVQSASGSAFVDQGSSAAGEVFIGPDLGGQPAAGSATLIQGPAAPGEVVAGPAAATPSGDQGTGTLDQSGAALMFSIN